MDKRILILGSAIFLTACSSVELVGSGSEANSKVPVSIEGYNLVTPAMASGGFCKGIPAKEGPDFEGSIYSYSTFLYAKDGFSIPVSDDPPECEFTVRSADLVQGMLRISAFEYLGEATQNINEAECREGTESFEGEAVCTFPEKKHIYNIRSMRIGSLESQQEELSGFAKAFDKYAELNIPKP